MCTCAFAYDANNVDVHSHCLTIGNWMIARVWVSRGCHMCGIISTDTAHCQAMPNIRIDTWNMLYVSSVTLLTALQKNNNK